MAISSFAPTGNGNPWYDSSVAWPDVQWKDDPLNTGFQYGEQNQQASWVKRLSDLGYGGTDAKSQFAQSLYSNAQQGYKAENINAPGLYWQHYLNKLDPNFIETEWQKQSHNMQGINDAQYSPNTRYLQRA